MACDKCERLSKAVQSERDPFRKKEAEVELRDHIDRMVRFLLDNAKHTHKLTHYYAQDAHRLLYMYQAAKVIQVNKMMLRMTDSNYSDVIMAVDASGGMGTVFHPHFHYFNKNEVQRHDLLKVHCMFVKVNIIRLLLMYYT
jgi:hypothetical protein